MRADKKLFLKILYILCACLTVFWLDISSAMALGLGLLFGVVLKNPFLETTKGLTHRLLSLAVIGLGAGMNLMVVAKVGSQGFLYTFLGIFLTISLGLVFGRLLKVEHNSSWLITVGTAICGGSAIASVAPVLKARQHEISIALGIVFLLNSIALLIFPHIGHYFALTQEQFGLWAALAIHDTSSVVGASLAYGTEALRIGTTVKLARALWIVPVTLMVGIYIAKFREKANEEGSEAKRKYPWFILGFLIAAALNTWLPIFQDVAGPIELIAKRLMVLTLFIIGSNLNLAILRGMGIKPVIQGLSLWLIAASVSLVAILKNWIHL
ncbi:MAG: putative sulfate exporter family transporter [Proteobacteria bacterium]|nr:MAG: putative sulfate exporter family transporter [Pseudomonadota bacterium]